MLVVEKQMTTQRSSERLRHVVSVNDVACGRGRRQQPHQVHDTTVSDYSDWLSPRPSLCSTVL